MKGYQLIPFKKLSLGLIQLSLLASAIAVGVSTTAFGKDLNCQKNKTTNNSCVLEKVHSPALPFTTRSSLTLKKTYKELLSLNLTGFYSVALKGHLSLYSGVSPPFS
jgi:hypothetical protein